MANYKLIKDKGRNANLILENEDTKTSVTLGKMTIEILTLLETDEGMTFELPDDDKTLMLNSPWLFNISDSTAKKLSSLAMKISKPKRDQRKKTPTVTEEKPKQVVDAMDVLLGLASYN